MSKPRVLILGGGQQGSVIARDLAPDHEVCVADQRDVMIAGVASQTADLSDRSALEALIADYDIAVGALLPGIGGGMAKAGMVEALYVGELVGLILIWLGYRFCVRAPLTQPQTSAPSPA